MSTFKLRIFAKIFAASILFLLLFTQCERNYKVELLNKTSTINGRIENYNNECKNGMIIYFDAISRLEKTKVFKIDSSGNFSVSFNLSHATFNTALLQLCDHWFSLFLEPGIDLKIITQNDSIQFLTDSGLSNSQLVMLEDTIRKKFKRENEFLKTLNKNKSDIEEYIAEHIKIAKKKIDFIDAYEKDHQLNQSVVEVLKNDINYSVALEWIRYGIEDTSRSTKTNEKLPENFHNDLFNTYRINNLNAISCRSYNDLIANIRIQYAETKEFGDIIDYIKHAYPFSNDELKMINGFFEKDSSITTSNEYEFFYNNGFKEILFENTHRYFVNNLLKKCEELQPGISRDLILSQGISFYYFNQLHIEPTEIEWNKLKRLIESDFILQYLHQLNDSFIDETANNSNSPGLPEDVKVYFDTLDEELLKKYQGNVVYLDFYSTWCIPCRKEIPFARELANYFENKEVSFIYICCLSEKENWRKMINQYKLKGDHYYLNDEEYTKLSSIYGVKGFPTYILIDKKGRVVNNNAPPPSLGSSIFNEIENLREEKF